MPPKKLPIFPWLVVHKFNSKTADIKQTQKYQGHLIMSGNLGGVESSQDD